MPTTRTRRHRTPNHKRLVEELAKFLVEPAERGQPRIVRSPLLRTGRQHITVIWDRWTGIPFSERSSIIIAANDSLPEADRVELIYAIGRTMEEAVALGYFPFRIAPLLRGSEREVQDRIEQAMRDEGAVETGEGLQFRFSTSEAAQDAYRCLQERMPGPYWAIIEEVYHDA